MKYIITERLGFVEAKKVTQLRRKETIYYSLIAFIIGWISAGTFYLDIITK
jgi:hypothetical protein